MDKSELARTLIDNSAPEGFNMDEVLKACFKDESITEVCIATGFWDLHGTELVYEELSEFLSREGSKFRLLIGKDPYLYASDTESLTKSRYDKQEQAWRVELDKFYAQEKYIKVVQMLIDNLRDQDSEKFQIHIYNPDGEKKSQFLHSKCYIFKGFNNKTQRKVGYGIIGSSNFTQPGLTENSELNILEIEQNNIITINENTRDKTHLQWFEEKWKDSVSWEKEFLLQVTQSKMGPNIKVPEPEPVDSIEIEPLTPYEVYIKYLQMQFGDIVDPSNNTLIRSYLPDQYATYNFQIDAVKQCFSIMKRYGGFILGDVVGLGKTVIGMLIIKKFLAEVSELGRPRRVLIVTPPSIKRGWVSTIEDFDRDAQEQIAPLIDFVTTGSLGKFIDDEDEDEEADEEEKLQQKLYGLILIDESHNFRNNDTQKYKDLDELIGQSIPTPYVGLLSATPQNNKPEDLQNQIYLFIREPNHCTLPLIEGGRLDSFFARMKELFNEARNNPNEEEARNLIAQMSKEIHDRVLVELVVRRTRSDIKERYEEDSTVLKFPTVMGPNKLEYQMDPELCQLFFDTVDAIYVRPTETFDPQKNIGFYRYAAITYFKSRANKELYESRNLTVDSISRRLENIMRILLVKRLESSFAAFKKSLHNLLDYTDTMVDMLHHDTVFVCPDIDVNKVYSDCDGDFDAFVATMREKAQKKGGNNLEFRATDFDDEYIVRLQEDRRLIQRLCKRWDANTYDPKMEKFKNSLESALFNPAINNPSHFDSPRLVIFTEAIDTQQELTRHLKARGYKVLSVSAKNRKEVQPLIYSNFDANAKEEDKKDDYNIIVTTEVLAEGVNLHRANVILNYDAPWNATRLVQRIGRVNRIGSKEAFVHVFNFFPEPLMNTQIQLIEKAYAKLQSFHLMFGEDNKVYSEREELSNVDLSHTIADESSPFNEYFNDLKTFQKSNPERYNYLKSLPSDHLGGLIKDGQDKDALVVFSDNTSGLVSVLWMEEVMSHTISQLETMAYLKAHQDGEFVSHLDAALEKRIFDEAHKVYASHVVHSLTAGDANKKIREALSALHQLRNMQGISEVSRRILKRVESGIKNRNTILIKSFIQFGKQMASEGSSLFGADEDINMWVETTFGQIASQAEQKRGEAYVALYEIY